ncbi:hypothetical protein AAG906_031149 [Vitis piasezkii]
MVENRYKPPSNAFIDNGGEFLAFKPYLEAHGILHRFHKIRHLVETGHALMAQTHKGYLCLDVSTNRIYISRNVIFHESSFPFQSSSPPSSPSPHLPSSTPALINSPSLSAPSSPAVSSPIITSDSIPPLIPVPFATSSPAAPSPPPLPLNTHPMVTRAKSGIHKKRSFIVSSSQQHRSLVPPPSSLTLLGRWIYKLKYRRWIHCRHKAHYFDTFSPVVKPCTIRLILALASPFNGHSAIGCGECFP